MYTPYTLKKRDLLVHDLKEISRPNSAGIKFYLIYVLKDTPLYYMYQEEKFKLLGKDEYLDLVVTLLEHLDPSIVIHRFTGEREREIFYAPEWVLDKNAVIQSIRETMKERKTF